MRRGADVIQRMRGIRVDGMSVLGVTRIHIFKTDTHDLVLSMLAKSAGAPGMTPEELRIAAFLHDAILTSSPGVLAVPETPI